MEYDLIVIGSGPGGEKGAAQAAYFGHRVAMIEKRSQVGGAGTNTGTLPSKTLRETSLMLSGLRARNLYGVDLSIGRQATVADFLFREKAVVQADQKRVEGNLNRHNIDLFEGVGRFRDAHTVEVLDSSQQVKEVLRAKKVLIATGSSPHQPEGFPFEHPGIFDSDQILNLTFMPKTMVVIGAGVIGCEYACTFAALGIRVTILEPRDTMLGFLDEEITRTLIQSMQDLGIHVRFGVKVDSCLTPDGGDVRLTLSDGTSLLTESVLVSSGRSGNTSELNLAAAGLEAGKRGQLLVNESYQTSVEHIYAVGDVIGFPALASTSMEQGRLAMVHAFDLRYKSNLAPILPYGIYTIPEIGMAGMSEQELKAQGVDYVVGHAHYSQNPRGMIIGDSRGFLKLIFEREDMRLLGVHVIGEQASELVHIGLMAIQQKAGADLFIQTCFNYPTLGDLYKYATYAALGARSRQ